MFERTNNELEQKDEQTTSEPGPSSKSSSKPRSALKKTKAFTNINKVLNVDPKVTNATTPNNDQALGWVRIHNNKSAFSIFQKNDGNITYETYIKYKSIGPKHIQEYLSIDSERNISQIKIGNKKSADISTQKIYIQIEKMPGKKDKEPAFNYKKISKHFGMVAVETYKVNSDTAKETEDKLTSKYKFAEKMVAARLAYGFTTRNDKKERPTIDLIMSANNNISLGKIINSYAQDDLLYIYDEIHSKQKKMKNVKESLTRLLILLKLVRAVYDLHKDGMVHLGLNLESVVLNISPGKLKKMDYINIQRDLRLHLRNFQNAAVIEEVDKDLKGILYSPEFTDPEIVKTKKLKKGQYQHFDYYALGIMIGVLFDCIVENEKASQDNSELTFFVYEGYEENLEPAKDCFKKYNLTDAESHGLAMFYFALTNENPLVRDDINLSDLIKMLGKIILRLEKELAPNTQVQLRGNVFQQVKVKKEKITMEANASLNKVIEENTEIEKKTSPKP